MECCVLVAEAVCASLEVCIHSSFHGLTSTGRVSAYVCHCTPSAYDGPIGVYISVFVCRVGTCIHELKVLLCHDLGGFLPLRPSDDLKHLLHEGH